MYLFEAAFFGSIKCDIVWDFFFRKEGESMEYMPLEYKWYDASKLCACVMFLLWPICRVHIYDFLYLLKIHETWFETALFFLVCKIIDVLLLPQDHNKKTNSCWYMRSMILKSRN